MLLAVQKDYVITRDHIKAILMVTYIFSLILVVYSKSLEKKGPDLVIHLT